MSLKAQLESNEVGCLSDKLLPNGWKVRRVQGKGRFTFYLRSRTSFSRATKLFWTLSIPIVTCLVRKILTRFKVYQGEAEDKKRRSKRDEGTK